MNLEGIAEGLHAQKKEPGPHIGGTGVGSIVRILSGSL